MKVLPTSPSLCLVYLKRENNEKKYLRPCLCSQSGYDERAGKVGDSCKDVKEGTLLLLLPWLPGWPQVEYGKGNAGQVEGAKDGSHRKGKSMICQHRKDKCHNSIVKRQMLPDGKTNATRWEGSLSLLQTCSIVKGAVKKVCTDSDVTKSIIIFIYDSKP